MRSNFVGVWASRHLLALIIVGGALLIPPALEADAAGAEWDVAVRTWAVEQFGSDVAVLRSDDAGAASRVASLLLSCSGPDRRIRLTLPDVIAGAGAGGTALIATADRADRRRAVVRFKLANASTVLIASGTSQSHDIAVAVARMLLAKPRALDFLLSVGAGPVAFTKLKVVRVLLSVRPQDVEAMTRFVDACGRFPAAQNG